MSGSIKVIQPDGSYVLLTGLEKAYHELHALVIASAPSKKVEGQILNAIEEYAVAFGKREFDKGYHKGYYNGFESPR
jgi:hypothetical protein